MSTKKILFATSVRIKNLTDSGIYHDLVEALSEENYVAVLCPVERRFKEKTSIVNNSNVKFINQRTFNIQKTNSFEKAISTFSLEYLFAYRLITSLNTTQFDILIITTPPIFFVFFIKIFKILNPKAKIYLLLKDIFPQNAIDLKLFRRNSFFHFLSKKAEKKLYEKCDHIGCMSIANLEYIKSKVPYIESKLEINPNSINPSKYPLLKKPSLKNEEKLKLIYGGNLGIPQDPKLICRFIYRLEQLKDVELLICGSGTCFNEIESFILKNEIKNTRLLGHVNRTDYFQLLEKSHVGLIFLNNSFTIPNFPSRLIDYILYEKTIISITDPITDINKFIVENNLGYTYTGLETQIEMAISTISNLRRLGLSKYNGNEIIQKNFHINTTKELIINKII